MKVKELIEILSKYNKEQEITNEQNMPFIHLRSTIDGQTILSTSKPIGICNRTGAYVYESVIDGYDAYCPELDEDLYNSEFEKINNL